MKRRDFLKFIGIFPATLLIRRLPGRKIELPVVEEPETPEGSRPVEDWNGDEELCFETQLCFTGPLPYKSRDYPYRLKLSKRIKYAWEELKWKIRSRLHGEDYWEDDY